MTCNLLIGDDLNVNRDLVIVGDTTQHSSTIPDSILNNLRLARMDLAKGELHNIILSLKEERAYIDTTVLNPNYDCIRDSLYRSEELAHECTIIALNIANNVTMDGAEIQDVIMMLFDQVFNQYVENNDDLIYIINRYIEVIDDSSELRDQDKESIKAGLATAIYSFNYWNVSL